MPRRFLVVPPAGGATRYRSLARLREALHAHGKRGPAACGDASGGSAGCGRSGARAALSWGPAVLVLALACAGCSGLPLASDDDLVTGSISPQRAALALPEGEAPKGIGRTDWAAAKLALDQALRSTKADISVPWENAETGAHGTSTPIGKARADGCRDFMIAVVDGKTTDRWVRGAACRSRDGVLLSQVRVLGQA